MDNVLENKFDDIERLIDKINILFSKRYYEELPKILNIKEIKMNDEKKLESIKDIFTKGGCSVYAKFLYEIFENEGAKIFEVNDHMVTEIKNKAYDVNGYNKIATNKIEANNIKALDLNKKEDLEYYNEYRDLCSSSLYCDDNIDMLSFYEQILNEIKDNILKNKEEMTLK